jgi:hypothetical protein
MAARDISIYGLSFFANFLIQRVVDHQAVLDALLKQKHGEGWLEKYKDGCKEYAEEVDKLAKEIEEASEAASVWLLRLGRLQKWRRYMEKVADNAPKERRDRLKRVAGFGLGSPTSDREVREFLKDVAPLVELRQQELVDLNVTQEAIDYPRLALRELTEAGADVVKERADVRLARRKMHRKRDVVATMVDDIQGAAEQVFQEAAFSTAPGAEQRRLAVEPLIDALQVSQAEATVQARKKAEQKPVLEELAVCPPPAPEAGGPEAATAGT